MAATSESVMATLEPDDEIRGQNFVCLSFLTPNRGLLRRKELFFFSEFLKYYALDYKIKSTESFVLSQLRDAQNALAEASLAVVNATDTAEAKKTTAANLDKIRGQLATASAESLRQHVEQNMADFRETTIVEEYEKWFTVNEQRLEDEFHRANDFQTTMHGLKVRGVYPSEEMAKTRAKNLSKKDPYFNVYVAPVGQWLPWDPNPDQVESSEYQNEELNKLMSSYKENQAQKEAFFEEQKRQKLAEAAAAAKAAKTAAAAQPQTVNSLPPPPPSSSPSLPPLSAPPPSSSKFQDNPSDLFEAQHDLFLSRKSKVDGSVSQHI